MARRAREAHGVRPGAVGAEVRPAAARSVRHDARTLCVAACVAIGSLAHAAGAATIDAGPADYRQLLRRLHAGDTLQLQPGIYREGLDVVDVIGTASAPISIVGARGVQRSVFVADARRNTVRIVNSAFVRVADLDLEGAGTPVDGVKAEGSSRFAHHVVIEGLRIRGFGVSQQNVGISTKCPAWNWVIRNNVVDGAGTGMYLGDSDGSAPFMRGTIEGNTIVGTRGYAIQIKHQNAWPRLEGMPEGRGATIIRYNTLAKDERSSADGLARPNLLLGHWPLSGRGSDDRYLVYGNLIVDNPHEALVQAEGSVVFYNNVLFNRFDDGLAIREHKDLPRTIDVFHNTIIARGVGALLRNGDPHFVQTLSANAIYAHEVNPPALAADNRVGRFDDADARAIAALVESPGGDDPVAASFTVPAPAATGERAAAAAARRALPDAALDFDRRPRSRDVDGAYAGDRPPDPRRFLGLARVLSASLH